MIFVAPAIFPFVLLAGLSFWQKFDHHCTQSPSRAVPFSGFVCCSLVHASLFPEK